ncbi:MAG TPA: glutathione S-transferase family protein [Vitreimonas sp.]|uniref:glutathione S-transferase family protein n=1 Tax=Vitreimonas sp. TaxID=3069702 RepID=UPI002D6DA346|nr:glutathione S-transferase family protein [Vitreimonas sp.]HYD87009.1 glutathione S-transferase family protein [Vitreimonas sp.]
MTILYGWGPMFGAPSPSPFVLKCDMQLQMFGAPFERAIADLDSVPKHKAPYVEDDGRIIEDSTFIRFYFEQKLGADLDSGLSFAERGAAWGLERMLEDRLAMIMAHERWLVDANFEKGPRLFFMDAPEPARTALCKEVREQLHTMMVRHGIGRHSREERMLLAERDISAVAAVLGDKPYLFGDTPSAVDASAFGVLSSCATPFFDTPLSGLVLEHANLRSYLQRLEARYFADVSWPTAMAA